MVDFNKHILNSDKFRPSAIFYEKHGCYTLAPRGTTDYIQFWDQETKRCLNGYVAPDGDAITGYHYFYLNYSPIQAIKEVEYVDKRGNKRKRRERIFAFPNFWDYDYYYFNAIEEAEEEGKHMAVLKSRQRGYSFKGASMLVRNYELIPGSKNFAVASEQTYLTSDGLLTKAFQIMDFIDQNTAWAKKRLTDTRLERESGFKITDEFGNETKDGYQSLIKGITLKNDPERIRGTRGKLVLWEEGGKFPGLLTAWRIEQPAVETDDGKAFGLCIAFGCVCAGTKVWTSTGDCIKIEDLKKEQGIIGWDTYQAVQQHIENINPPSKKPCLRITTNTGRTLECSTDHPLLWSTPGKTRRVLGKRAENEHMKAWLWHEAEKCKVGDQIGIINSIPFFGTKKMWEPRLVGWLIGDGSYGRDHTPRLCNCDDEINNYVKTHFDTSSDSESRYTKDGKLCKETRIKGICGKLRELGIYAQTKKNKRLPLNIHQYDAESLSELIGGLFDTDGYLAIDKTGRPRITLTQCQEEILREIEEVLLHFGVHCSIKFIHTKNREHVSNGRVIKDGEGHWRLSINDITSIANFAEYICCSVAYKQSVLDLMKLFTQEHLARYNKYVCGIHAEKIVKIEDIGEQTIYNLTAQEQHDYICNGIVTHNTGGTEGGSFDGLKELFYKPDAYNVLSFPNIWDDNAADTRCGFFVPSWSNMESLDEEGNQRFMDKDGNSRRELAVQELMKQRNKIKDGGASQQSIDRFISERPLKPQEAVLELGKNIFPRKLLMDQLTRIRTNKKLQSMKHIVDLSWGSDGKVEAHEKKSGDITTYHLKKDDKPEGSVVIWEYPVTDPPFGLYIGGCLTPGEKVCTQRGLVPVEDVTLDDKLINKLGNFVEINNLQRYYKENEDVFRIKMANSFRTTQFTSEHPIYVCDKYYQKCRFVKAKDIKVGQYTRIPNLYWNTNEDVYTPLKHTDFWWFVGLWLGDGWVDDKKYSVSISFDLKQPSFYNQYYRFLKENNIVPYSRKRNGSLEVKFTNKDTCVWLTQTFGKYCYGKHIPDKIKRISYNNKLKLLQGYLDSDGSVCVNKKTNRNSIEFVSVNLQLLEDIQDVCFGLNVVGSINRLREVKKSKIQGRVVTQRETYHLRIAHNNSCNLAISMILNSSFKDEKLQRMNICANIKKNTSKDCVCVGPYIYIRIKAIQQSKYTGIVYNFECDTHTFMCRSIMTHNCDPYDHDESFTNSLGSTFIFKRIQMGEVWQDVIVAEYTGRPATAEEYYENVRKLLLFYNARLLFENERKGIYPYFTNKHCDYLLADQPDKVISEVFKDSKVQRRKGCHMTKQIRAYGEGLILEYLMEEYEPGHLNVERIFSEALIEELIENDGVKNVDRVIALCMVMLYREELYQVKVAAAQESNKQVELFDMPLFSSQYWNDEPQSDEVIPTFSL